MTSFLKSQSGAVTVDWVVLTAALVGISLAAMGVILPAMELISFDIKAQLDSDIIDTTFGDDPVPGNQCPEGWRDTLINDYAYDPVDIDDDVLLYNTMTDPDLIAAMATYTNTGGFGIVENENQVQIILCEMDARGIVNDTRVF